MKTFITKLRWLIQRRDKDAELRAEIEFHLEEEAEERKAAGLSEDDARLTARRDFGSRALVQEDTRATWGWTWVERARQDLRYAARLLCRRPVFSVTAIVTLMLSMGATTATFSLLDSLLMRTLPVERPDELVRLGERSPDGGQTVEAFTLVTHETLQRESRTFAGVLASERVVGGPAEIDVGTEKQHAYVQLVSDNYFDVLGIRAWRGRTFHRQEPGSPGEPIAVISEEYWRREYGSDLSALGARFRRGNREFTIAGVAPPGFRGTEIDVPMDIWVPVEQVVPPDSPSRVRGRWMRILGRLEPGTTPAAAEAELSSILGRPVNSQPGGIGYSTLRVQLYRPLLLEGQNPLGARFFREGGSRSGELMDVVGVVKDSKWVNLRDDSPAMYYTPYLQMGGTPVVRLAVRTSGDPESLAGDLLRVAGAIDKRMVLSNVVPFREIVDRTVVIERLVAQVSAAFGLLALAIAAVGLYGVLAYSVVRRRREIGLRVAIGARPATVEWMFLRESLTLLGAGVAIGLPVALLLNRLVSSMLFGLSPHDPASIGIALTVLTLATVAAAYLPARRAGGMDPIIALREE